MKAIQWLISAVDLQCADDGDTTHYGGSFKVNNEDYTFNGSDRNTCPADIISCAMAQEAGASYAPEDFVVEELMDKLEQFVTSEDIHKSLLIQIEGDRVVVDLME